MVVNAEAITAATNSTYTRANVQPPDLGEHRAVITNALGAVTSAPAALTVGYSLTSGGTLKRYNAERCTNSLQPDQPWRAVLTVLASQPFNA